MPKVTIEAFNSLRAASRAMAENEFRKYLEDTGCPPDKIEEQVRKFMEESDAQEAAWLEARTRT